MDKVELAKRYLLDIKKRHEDDMNLYVGVVTELLDGDMMEFHKLYKELFYEYLQGEISLEMLIENIGLYELRKTMKEKADIKT